MAQKAHEIAGLLAGNPYPGRGIVVGESAAGESCLAYFIMGRSENSRNRILQEEEGALFTRPYDASKVKDPSLIIYAAMRRVGDAVILTNGDQTDTIACALSEGGNFFDALETRTFEPDSPNYTPRISALLRLSDGSYDMSILRRGKVAPFACERARFSFAAERGVGHFLHTYVTDGDPLPSFEGAPKQVLIPAGIDEFASSLWEALDQSNKISLFVRFIDRKTGRETTRLFNKNDRRER